MVNSAVTVHYMCWPLPLPPPPPNKLLERHSNSARLCPVPCVPCSYPVSRGSYRVVTAAARQARGIPRCRTGLLCSREFQSLTLLSRLLPAWRALSHAGCLCSRDFHSHGCRHGCCPPGSRWLALARAGSRSSAPVRSASLSFRPTAAVPVFACLDRTFPWPTRARVRRLAPYTGAEQIHDAYHVTRVSAVQDFGRSRRSQRGSYSGVTTAGDSP